MEDSRLLDLHSSIYDVLADQSIKTCYQWATRRRRIASIETGDEMAYSARLHPWVVEMHNSKASYNWAMKGAQLGITEVIINRALYALDKLRKDVLYVLPTLTTASDFSKARFGGALSLSDYLKRLFTDTNAVNIKQAGDRTLYIRGAGGKGNLVSIPVGELLLDEVDRMPLKQVWLALERLSGQLRKSVWGISTPTIPNKGIHKLYQDSSQEHFFFKCPRCGRSTEFTWPDSFELCGEHPTDPDCERSFLKCLECNGQLEHQQKPDYLAGGIWTPTNDAHRNRDVRGFYINQLYSFTITPGELAVAFLRGNGDEFALQEFHNSKAGQPFIGDGAQVDDVMLDSCIRAYTKKDPPPNKAGRLITMGVDRGRWNYVEVTEWFLPKNRRTLDANAAAKSKVLFETKFLDEDFDQMVNMLMRKWQVLGCVVDADPGPMDARRFARRYPGFVWLCRYRSGVRGREITISEEDDGAPMATVDRTNWLAAALGRFKADPPTIELPRDVSNDYREHMKALVARYEKDDDGEPYLDYVKTDADHFAHTRAYSEIALSLVVSRMGFSEDLKK